MKQLLFCLCMLSFVISKSQNTDSAWIRDNYTKKEVYITMRDGIRLFTSLYIPKDTKETHPVLMTRTPYSCEPYGENNWINYADSYQKEYLRQGYIMVTQDVRGRWMSEGAFKDVRPFNADKKGKEIDEASDTYDAIDWLVKNIPGKNGKVGVFVKVPKPAKGTPTKSQRKNSGTIEIKARAERTKPNTVIKRSGL